MSTRRWQVPAAVAEAAASAPATTVLEAERNRDLAARVPVGADTLSALIASSIAGHSVPGPVYEWARSTTERNLFGETNTTVNALLAAGLVLSDTATGVLDPDFDGERIVAVIRAGADGLERWTDEGWEIAAHPLPEGVPYVELHSDVLADALTATAAGGSLILNPTKPRAFLSDKRGDLPIVTASGLPGQPGSLYAVTDPLDTTAVVTLFAAAAGPSGPVLTVRRAGSWAPDDGTLLAQLTSVAPPPVISVPPDQAVAVLRQVDDFDSTHPQTATHPTGGELKHAALAAAANGDGHSDDVMVAIPVPAELAHKLTADGADVPAGQQHITLAYLGHKTDCPPKEKLLERVRDFASARSPLKGTIGGGGLFTGAGEDGRTAVAVALPDIPGLNEYRSDLVGSLEGEGAEVADDHGFTPHITLKWNADRAIVPGNHDIGVPGVALYYGDEVHHVPFGVDAVAASAHDDRVRAARNADSDFDRERAEQDLAEAQRRRTFEQRLGRRHTELASEGVDPDEAVSAVVREIAAEDDRRELWERDRADALAAEKARRHGAHSDLRASEAQNRDSEAAPITAAVAHTAMPKALREYWLHGKGAAKVRWGTAGDWARAVRYLARYMDLYRAKAAANELHRLATGRWTGSRANRLIEGGKA